MNDFIEFLSGLDGTQSELIRKYEFLRHEYGMMSLSAQPGSLRDMERFGYPFSLAERMLPIDEGLAMRFFEEGCEVNLLYPDGSKKVVSALEEIGFHVSSNGKLGITEHDLEYEYKKSERFFIGEQYM